MAYDAHVNFAISTVATAPSPATSGTSLTLAAGAGALFPAAPFNVTIWPASVIPTASNAEIARVTAKVTDTLTLTRAQEGTTARAVVVGDQIMAAVTVKVLTDIEALAKGGDVVGPATATLMGIPRYNDTTGKVLRDSTTRLANDGSLLLPNGGNVTMGSRFVMTSSSDGSVIFSNGTNTDFGILMLGGAAFPSTSPALKKNGAVLEVRLGDDSDYTALSAKTEVPGTNNNHVATTAFVVAAGYVVGPAVATANALALFDGTTGKLLQDSGTTVANLARRNLANTFTGDNVFTAELRVEEANPFLRLKDPSAPADKHDWYVQVSGTDFLVYPAKDDGSNPFPGAVSLQLQRSTNDVVLGGTNLRFGAASTSNPKLKRASAGLEARLGDDSDLTTLRAKLDAGDLVSGALPDARLSANVARRDQANTFTQTNVFTPSQVFQSFVSLVGGQLQFPATQVPSSDPNTLDDYREATWTPTDLSGAGLSFSVAGCLYTRIGRQVFLSGALTWPTTSNSANAAVSLPLTPLSTGYFGGSVTFTDYGTPITVHIAGFLGYMSFHTFAGVSLTNANLSGKSVRLVLQYCT